MWHMGKNKSQFRAYLQHATYYLLLVATCHLPLATAQTKTTGKVRHTGHTGGGTLPGSPVVNLSASSLAFGNQVVNTTSGPQVLTLTNVGTGSLTITSIITTGNFAATTTCGGTLAAGANCIINVTFTPLSVASLTGAVTITDNAAGTPHVVTLSGTGTAVPSGYGNTGNPYANHPGWPLAHTSISGCATITPAANTYYLLTGNIGSDPTANCITLNFTSNAGWVFDLGGFAVTGTFVVNASTNAGDVLNGSITCAASDPVTCFKAQGPTSTSGTQTQFEFLTVGNSFAGAAQARAFWVESVASTAWTGSGYRLHIHNLTVNNPHTSVGNRSHGISIVSSSTNPGQSVQVDHNSLNTPIDADQAWGADLFNVWNWSFDNNLCTLLTHNAGLTYGECLNWEPGTNPPPIMNGIFTANDVTLNNNRGLRLWGACSGTSALTISNNLFRTINLDVADKRWGAVSLGEAGCSSPQVFTSTILSGNTYQIIRGQGIQISGAQGPLIQNETATCPSGCVAGSNFAWANVANTGPSPASFTAKNNTVTDFTTAGVPPVIACGVPGNAAYVCAIGGTATSTVTVCNSGTAAGNGSITNLSSPCP